MDTEKKKIIAVVGPTASGKTSLAVALAERFNGEIISCDSMQIYRGMDVGTAKVTAAEMHGIRHHMIDVADPGENYSCSDYRKVAAACVEDVLSRGKLPIFCGGTGLYLDSVLSVSDLSPEISGEITERVELLTPDEAWEELNKADPDSAAKTHRNNVRRVKRALEIYLGTGVTKTEWDRRSKLTESPYDVLYVKLTFSDRELLYRRIDRRVDAMLENGLVKECEKLALDRDSTAGQAIGYKEIYRFLDGELTLAEATELLKKNTRNYAKRQLTWFRRYPSEGEIAVDSGSFGKIFEKSVNIVEKHLSL